MFTSPLLLALTLGTASVAPSVAPLRLERAGGGQAPPAPETRSAPPPAPAAQPAGPAAPDVGAFADVDATSMPLEPLSLSDVLKSAMTDNIDVRSRVVDVSVSEAGILSALGVYDVRFTAGADAMYQRQTPRGSQFVFSTGSRRMSGNVGLSRKLETGGTVELRLTGARTLTDQPRSFFNPAAGSAELAEYNVAPVLTLTHPLLRGLGVRVNRAAIDRARVATSQAEAEELNTAQNLVKDIVSSYWDVLFAQRDLENKRRSVDLSRRQLDRTLVQVSAGRLAPVEAKAVEQSLASGESEVLIAENTLVDRSLTLRTLMGQQFAERDVLGVLPSTDPTDIRPTLFDQREQIKRALAAHPQVRQLEIALASKRIDELEAANNRLPQLNFTGSFSPTGRSVDALPDEPPGAPAQRGSWGDAFGNFISDDIGEDGLLADFRVSGQLDLTWDIQNRTAKGNHQRVQLEMRKAELNLEQMQQTIAASVLRAINNLRTAGKRMEVAVISVELAQQNLAAEEARFEVGRSTNYDVLMRIDELSGAETEALNAQISYLRGLVELQALTGEILPAFGLDLASYG